MSDTAGPTGQPSSAAQVPGPRTQFTVDLGQLELTDEEISSFQNKLTQLAAESVQQAMRAAPGPQGEPFVKILHVKQIHSKHIR